MPTVINDKDVAHTASDHIAPGPPATSMIPPVPPGPGPVPAPFVYVAKSSSATGTSARCVFGAGQHPVLKKGSKMDVELPGNQPSQPVPPPHDVVTTVVNKAATMTTASNKVTSGGFKVCKTFDSVALNVQMPGGQISQAKGKLLAGADVRAATPEIARGMGAQALVGEPVGVVTGEVLDEWVDLALPGTIPVEWKRLYASGRAAEPSPFGRGGFTHNFDQWIEPAPRGLRLRDHEGHDVPLPAPPSGGEAFHRGKRLVLRAGREAHTFELFDLDSRLTRRFAPLVPGGRSMLREIRDAWGNRIALTYEGGCLKRITDTAGRELNLVHDEHERVVRAEVCARGRTLQVVAYGYTDAGELARATDALGSAETYEYDGAHRLTVKTLANGLRFHYRYDKKTGRCVASRGDGGFHPVELAYDLAKRTTTVHGTPEPRIFTWNEKGAVGREETFDHEWVRETVYDDDLLVLAETNAAGETVRYEYDARGHCTRHTDAAGNVTVWEFEDDQAVQRIGPDGLATRWIYDARGGLLSITAPTGHSYSFDRDGAGRVTRVYGPDGLIVAYEYDAEHNLVSETDGLGRGRRYEYDALGRPIIRIDADGRKTRVEYDALGRVVARHHPDGAREEMTYDARGNLVQHVAPAGVLTRRKYAGTASHVEQIAPDEQVWTLRYDAMERLVEVKNPKAETYALRYDRAGRVVERTTFDGAATRYCWNRAGRLARIEYPDDTWREFQYDPLGNIILDDSPHGRVTYTRDAQGRVVDATVDEPTGEVTIRRVLDALGRVIAEEQDGATVRYEYDDRDRRAARILPWGATTHYHYDFLGQILGLDHDGYKVLFERSAEGLPTRRYAYQGGVSLVEGRDDVGRIARQIVITQGDGPSARPLVERSYRRDAAGRVQSIADQRWGSTRYSYDACGQLVEARHAGHDEQFEYDVAGSLVGRAPGASPPWRVEMGNVLRRTETAEYEVDRRGRRRRKIHLEDGHPTGEVTEYFWDCRDQLREVVLPSGTRIRYTYDPFGRRLRKTVVPAPSPESILDPQTTPKVTRYVWDGNVVAGESDDAGKHRTFVDEPDTMHPVLHEEHGEVFLVVSDHVGVPKELVDSTGRLAWAAAHSAWGSVIEARCDRGEETPPVRSPFRLLGQYFDEDINLCFTRFRDFDPETGRWLTPDPFGIAGGTNLFGWNGSPTVDIDPFGLCKNRFQYATKWHDARATSIFGDLPGRKSPPKFKPRRTFDKSYNGKDIEFKGDNFQKEPRTKAEIDHMMKEADKDIRLKNLPPENQPSPPYDPHWHFENDPTVAPEMQPVLDRLRNGGIPMTWGYSPFQNPIP